MSARCIDQWLKNLRPLALRRLKIARPPLVAFLARKPALRLRTRWLGSYVSLGPFRTCNPMFANAGFAEIFGTRSRPTAEERIGWIRAVDGRLGRKGRLESMDGRFEVEIREKCLCRFTCQLFLFTRLTIRKADLLLAAGRIVLSRRAGPPSRRSEPLHHEHNAMSPSVTCRAGLNVFVEVVRLSSCDN
jgi:hypothetical protein